MAYIWGMLKLPWRQSGLAALAGLALIWAGCETDVDLTADYQRTPVVFCLLDVAQDTQWVRINRTWLGDGNQLDAALIADSSEYDPADVEARITEYRNGVAFRSWTLRDTLLQNKSDDGIFFGPEHQAWYMVQPGGLEGNSTYELEIDFADGTSVRGETRGISEVAGNITQPPPGVPNFKLGFANIGFATTYPDVSFKWSSTAGGFRYEPQLVVHFTEHLWADDAHTQLVSSAEKSLSWALGSVDANSEAGGQLLTKSINGERFFTTLASQLEAHPRITRELGVWDEQVQIARAFDFILSVANEELSIYLDINAPVTGIIQERPEYTNLVGGLGLFAARSSQGVYGIGYSTDTMEELAEGDLTAPLQFCTPNPFSDYACP